MPKIREEIMNGAKFVISDIENLFDKIPVPIFIVDDEGSIQALNEMAAGFAGHPKEYYYDKRSGDAFNCSYALDNPEGCGHGACCSDCVIRNSMQLAMRGEKVTRKIHLMDISTTDGSSVFITILVSASPIDYVGRRLALITLEDISELMHLRDIIPICAHCKKIRNDTDYWESVEAFLLKHADLRFSHGICPDCIKALYPELSDLIELQKMTMAEPELSLAE